MEELHSVSTASNPKKPFYKRIYKAHEPYFGFVYKASFFIGVIYAFFEWVAQMFETAQDGNVIGFVVVFFMQTIIQMLTAVIFTLIVGTLASIIFFLPYLVIRGLIKS
jgi:hypothetical protein